MTSFLFLVFSSCSHNQISEKNISRGVAQVENHNTDCLGLLSEVLIENSEVLTSKETLNRIEKQLDQLENLKAQEYIQTLTTIEKELDSLSEYILKSQNDEDLETLLSFYYKINEFKIGQRGNYESFGFKKLKALVTNVFINKDKRITNINHQIKDDLLTKRKLRLLKSKKISSYSPEDALKFVEEIIYLQEVHPAQALHEQFDWSYFKSWFVNQSPHIEWSEYREIGQVYEDLLEQFKATAQMTKKARKESVAKAQNKYFEQYNHLVNLNITNFKDHEDFITHVHLMLSSYSAIDPIFKGNDFFNYLSKNNILNEEYYSKFLNKHLDGGDHVTLGTILNQKYSNFAPYALSKTKDVKDKNFLKRFQSKIKEVVGKTKYEFNSCNTKECYIQKIRNNFLFFTKSDFYKKNFNCLSSNPFIIRSMIMDFAIVHGSLVVYYFSDDEMERFPFEILANNMIFTPIMGEANCRASFKGPLNFGEVLQRKDVFASTAVKAKRFGAKLTDLSLKGAMATVGLMSFTYGMDSLYLALGHSVSNPSNLAEMAQVLPFMFAYYAIWNNVKGLAFQNPIRHKLIPKIARIFETKTKIKGSLIYAQTGLDLFAFYYLSMYHNWEYLNFYQNTLEPWWKETIGLTDNSEELKTSITEDEQSIQITTEFPNGIRTQSTFERDGDLIQLKGVDLDLPDEIIETYFEKSLMP